jgi:hypothetical protein
MRITADPETPPGTLPDDPVQEPGTPPIPLHEPDPDTAPAERRTAASEFDASFKNK